MRHLGLHACVPGGQGGQSGDRVWHIIRHSLHLNTSMIRGHSHDRAGGADGCVHR